MAELPNLTNRLLVRLPGRSNTELGGWINESALQHGYATVTDIPAKAETAIIEYARYIALQAKAAETAENAAIDAKGISINDTGASGNYEKLIATALKDYRRAAARAVIRVIGGGNVASISLPRPDGR